MIKAVIYDFDDTIVDSDPLHIQSWEQNLKDHQVQNIADFKIFREENMMGKSSRENAKLLVNHYKLDVDPEDFYHKKADIYMKNAIDKLKLLPGVVYSLKLFKKMGLRLAVASGSPRKYIDAVINRLGLKEYFELIVSADDIQKSKPDPQSFIVTCSKLELDPVECIVIEDATVGVQSAKAAGCKCIAIPNRNVTTQDYSEADLVLKSLTEITKNDIISLNND